MKTKFHNRTFFVLVIIVLSGLLFYNALTLLTTGNLIALLPLVFQGTLLALILTSHKYTRPILKVWAIILIISAGFWLFGRSLKILVGDDVTSSIVPGIFRVVLLLLGLYIYGNVKESVTIEEIPEMKKE